MRLVAFPCIFHKRGQCTEGSNCIFTHLDTANSVKYQTFLRRTLRSRKNKAKGSKTVAVDLFFPKQLQHSAEKPQARLCSPRIHRLAMTSFSPNRTSIALDITQNSRTSEGHIERTGQRSFIQHDRLRIVDISASLRIGAADLSQKSCRKQSDPQTERSLSELRMCRLSI